MITSSVRVIFCVWLIALAACKQDDSDDSIPYVPFPNIVINLSLPEYFTLQSVGNYKVINDGGVKGIILYHHSSGEYYAFERNCSYHPNEACSTVGVDATGLRMNDTCCGSVFDFEGNPVGGPAWRPLRRYATQLTGSQLTITDQIASE
jgi:hypothetical protein